jgi:CheY-like chemotaxis protein
MTPAPSQLEPSRTSILLVEDAPADLLALESLLKPLGQRLVRALSGEEALSCCLQEDFAVILLDVGLPGLDGFETARQLRQQERTRHTPIIFMSGPSRERFQVLQGYSLGPWTTCSSPMSRRSSGPRWPSSWTWPSPARR